MPTDAAEARERDVVGLIVEVTRSAASGLSVDVVGWPDRERSTGSFPESLTVDAVLRLTAADGTVGEWAADVMTLSWHSQLKPAVESMERRLHEPLARLSRESKRRIIVSFDPPVGRPQDEGAYAEAIIGRVEDLIRGDNSRNPFENDPSTCIELGGDLAVSDAADVNLMHSLTQTASVRDQLVATLVAPLRKKLRGQLRRAHEAGYPTMLLIDGWGAADLFAGANFIASGATVGQVVAETVIAEQHAGGSHVLDFRALVQSDNTASPVYGYWPQRPAP